MRLAAALFLLLCAGAPAASEPQLRGEWEQGGVIFGSVQPGTRVWLNDQPLRVTPGGEFVLGLDRDEPAEVTLRLQPPGAPAPLERRYPVRKRQYLIQRLQLPPSMVNPPPETLARIRREQQKITAARERDSALTAFTESFIWPTVGPISGVFGSQRILNGEPKQPHYGVDVAVPTGTPVVAPAGGIVSLAEPDLYYTGGTVMIDHGHGLSSAFLHLSRLHVQAGQTVKQGDLIGEVGATGRATGAHLDWRINWFGRRVDAQKLVPPMPEQN
ncbi:MAG: M23 family metallopeptidase [Gammaproteobacteria bacterium]